MKKLRHHSGPKRSEFARASSIYSKERFWDCWPMYPRVMSCGLIDGHVKQRIREFVSGEEGAYLRDLLKRAKVDLVRGLDKPTPKEIVAIIAETLWQIYRDPSLDPIVDGVIQDKDRHKVALRIKSSSALLRKVINTLRAYNVALPNQDDEISFFIRRGTSALNLLDDLSDKFPLLKGRWPHLLSSPHKSHRGRPMDIRKNSARDELIKFFRYRYGQPNFPLIADVLNFLTGSNIGEATVKVSAARQNTQVKKFLKDPFITPHVRPSNHK